MAILTQAEIKQIAEEIKGEAENTRRKNHEKRQKIYRDGGKEFLIEDIRSEFGHEALREMRLAPINILRKIINRRSSIYDKPPVRAVNNGLDSDQELVDYYVDKLSMDTVMGKANRYFNLHANTAIYPIVTEEIKSVEVVPPHLYSVKATRWDRTKIDCYVFSNFVASDRLTPEKQQQSPTGQNTIPREQFSKDKGTLIENSANTLDDQTNVLIFWTDEQHFTTDENGNVISFRGEDDNQFLNPLGKLPVVNLAKERDNETWSEEGEALVDNAMLLQKALTDVFTIAKMQGFSILTVISPDPPQQLQIGLNKTVWLRQEDGKPDPSISYVNASSPLSDYMDLAKQHLALTLSTNDMSPGSIGGSLDASNFSSGFARLIEMSDTLMAVEADKPYLRDAELDTWEIIKSWHNWLFDAGFLKEEERALGKFSEDFSVNLTYRDIKPIESEAERIATTKQLLDMKLITKRDAIKRLNPDMSDEQIDARLEEIKMEMEEKRKAFMEGMSGQGSVQVQPPSGNTDDERAEGEGEEEDQGSDQGRDQR